MTTTRPNSKQNNRSAPFRRCSSHHVARVRSDGCCQLSWRGFWSGRGPQLGRLLAGDGGPAVDSAGGSTCGVLPLNRCPAAWHRHDRRPVWGILRSDLRRSSGRPAHAAPAARCLPHAPRRHLPPTRWSHWNSAMAQYSRTPTCRSLRRRCCTPGSCYSPTTASDKRR